MRVLVTTASNGVTEAIGARIGSVLGGRGHQVDVRTPAEVITVDSYDIVVLGSAVDDGRWQEDARRLVVREKADLASRPVWLFSSGPAAVSRTTDGTVVDVTDVMNATHAFEHRVFAADAERGTVSLPEAGAVTAVLVAENDDDTWDDVDRWAAAIADSISSG